MKTGITPMFWMLVAIATIGAAMILFRSHPRRQWGFKESVKDPKQWGEDMEQASRALERATEEAKQWTEAQISAAVNRFIFDVVSSQDAGEDASVLESLGPRIHSSVLQILSDDSLRSRLVVPTGTNLVPEAPFNRACLLLGDTPPAGAAGLIAPFLDERSKEIRHDAALVLGKIGTPDVVGPLRKAFADRDEDVRSYGLMGLEWAIGKGRLHEQCARGLYDDIAQLVLTGKSDASARLLLHIDQERATGLFLSEKVFAPNAPSLHQALEALANKRIPVPRDRLLRLIAGLEAGDLKYPRSYALGAALHLLGQNKVADDRSLLEIRTGSSERIVAERAMMGLIASFGLEGFDQRAWELEDKNGFAALNSPQKHYLAVLMFDGEVNNGGLSQYFFNSSGDYWRDALAGLEAMGLTERFVVLRTAIAKFGKDGPSEDRERRQNQLAKLERKSDGSFEALDERYFKSKEAVEVLAKRYVLKNPDAFR